jgi:rod shape-determining protein MreC
MDKRFRNLIIILSGIILLISIGYSNGGRTSVTIVENIASRIIIPIQSFLFDVSYTTSERINDISEVWENKERIKILEKENNLLNEKVVKLSLEKSEFDELNKLKSNLNYIEKNDFENYVTCNVISKDMGNWFEVFSINAGIEQGVKKYSIVVSENGLVGKVYETGNNFSKVISIINNKSNISFKTNNIININYQGFINTAEDGLLKGNLFDPNANISLGTNVITTGQGIYPEGILIGEIVKIKDDKDEFLKEVFIKPFADFRSINMVTVITIDSEKNEWIYEN